jgi:hypothetical protein
MIDIVTARTVVIQNEVTRKAQPMTKTEKCTCGGAPWPGLMTVHAINCPAYANEDGDSGALPDKKKKADRSLKVKDRGVTTPIISPVVTGETGELWKVAVVDQTWEEEFYNKFVFSDGYIVEQRPKKILAFIRKLLKSK